MTAAVTMLKVFGDKITNSPNAKPKKLLKKPTKWLNSKKKALNRPFKGHGIGGKDIPIMAHLAKGKMLE